MVIAETRDQAKDAAELIDIDYEELPAVVSTGDATKPGAPQVWDAGQEQHLLRLAHRRQGGDRRGLRQGRARHQDRPRQQPPDPQRDGAARRDRRLRPRDRRLHALHHQPEPARHPPADGRLRAADSRSTSCASWRPTSAAASARRSSTTPRRRSSPGRPARSAGRSSGRPSAASPSCPTRMAATTSPMPSWRWTRTASSSACGSSTIANMGAYLSTFAPVRPDLSLRDAAGRASTRRRRSMPRCKAVFTNTVPVDAYRGAGRPEATYLLERLVDKAARETGDGPRRDPPEELHPGRRLPLPDAGRAAIRQRRLPGDARRWR